MVATKLIRQHLPVESPESARRSQSCGGLNGRCPERAAPTGLEGPVRLAG